MAFLTLAEAVARLSRAQLQGHPLSPYRGQPKRCIGNYFSFSIQVFDVAFCTLSLPHLLSLFLISPPPFLCSGCCSSAADAFQQHVQRALPTFLGMASPAATLCMRCRGWWPAHMATSSLQVTRISASFLGVRPRFTAQSIRGTRERRSGAVMQHLGCCSPLILFLLIPACKGSG